MRQHTRCTMQHALPTTTYRASLSFQVCRAHPSHRHLDQQKLLHHRTSPFAILHLARYLHVHTFIPAVEKCNITSDTACRCSDGYQLRAMTSVRAHHLPAVCFCNTLSMHQAHHSVRQQWRHSLHYHHLYRLDLTTRPQLALHSMPRFPTVFLF